MNSLPQNFLVVNHEGVTRCRIDFEPVTDFNRLVARFAQHKMLMVKSLASHPNGLIHVGLHTREGLPIVILEANQGTMGLQTHYHLVKQKEGQEWISPRFLKNETGSFELRCEFDFGVWAESGLKLFFAINHIDYEIQTWVWWNNQNYRVPFGNVFETGAICLGSGSKDSYFDIPVSGIDKLLAHLSASIWNADAFDTRCISPIAQLVRFDAKSLKMLLPLNPEAILKLGIMAQPTIAEATKLIYG